jgi:hypothetical protein
VPCLGRPWILRRGVMLTAFQPWQVARIAAVFQVDEIVVYHDPSGARGAKGSGSQAFFARLLEYMETPQYLRKVSAEKEKKTSRGLPRSLNPEVLGRMESRPSEGTEEGPAKKHGRLRAANSVEASWISPSGARS